MLLLKQDFYTTKRVANCAEQFQLETRNTNQALRAHGRNTGKSLPVKLQSVKLKRDYEI
jgi:hypothetical protein